MKGGARKKNGFTLEHKSGTAHRQELKIQGSYNAAYCVKHTCDTITSHQLRLKVRDQKQSGYRHTVRPLEHSRGTVLRTDTRENV